MPDDVEETPDPFEQWSNEAIAACDTARSELQRTGFRGEAAFERAMQELFGAGCPPDRAGFLMALIAHALDEADKVPDDGPLIVTGPAGRH